MDRLIPKAGECRLERKPTWLIAGRFASTRNDELSADMAIYSGGQDD